MIITFLQQEFVLLPELNNIDLVGEEIKIQMLAEWQKWRWASFVVAPLILLLRLSLVSLCMFLGSFFFVDMTGKEFKDWWGVAMLAQSVMVFYGIVLCIVNIVGRANEALVVSKYTSLLFLGGDNVESWIKLPLSAVNVFEISYWLIMSKVVSVKARTTFGRSFKFVISSYGVGYLFYIALLMFLILYLS